MAIGGHRRSAIGDCISESRYAYFTLFTLLTLLTLLTYIPYLPYLLVHFHGFIPSPSAKENYKREAKLREVARGEKLEAAIGGRWLAIGGDRWLAIGTHRSAIADRRSAVGDRPLAIGYRRSRRSSVVACCSFVCSHSLDVRKRSAD